MPEEHTITGWILSSLKVNQIKAKIRAVFEPFIDVGDIGVGDKERDTKVLTRCLAAFALYHHAGCSPKEAGEAVWDGGDDNGIDAAYYDASESRVIFVQSKWIQKGAGEPEAKDIGSFTKGVRDAIELEFDEFHQDLQPKLNDISSWLTTPGTRVHIVLVSTGASKLAKHGAGRLERLVSELNGEDPDPFASWEMMGLLEVYSALASDSAQGTLVLDATLLEWSLVASPYTAYFGVIDGLQLKRWWQKHGKRVVSANIRHALGATEVNNEIRITAATAPEKFWYFNNGITVVADEVVRAPSTATSRSAGNFSFRGASIVNGAQTVSSLAKVDDDNALGNVRVSVRAVILKNSPSSFGEEVTRTNNHQNRVESRDFVARDPEQKRLRNEMAIEEIDYQFLRSEDVASSQTSCELLEVTTALACASGDSALAVHLKTGIGRFFADLKKYPYRAIFNPQTGGARAFNAVLTQRVIDGWIEKKKRGVAKKSGIPWGVLVHGNRILSSAVFARLGEKHLQRTIAEFVANVNAPAVEVECEKAYGQIIAVIQRSYSKKFLGVLFKNITSCKHVFDVAVA